MVGEAVGEVVGEVGGGGGMGWRWGSGLDLVGELGSFFLKVRNDLGYRLQLPSHSSSWL